MDFTVDQPAIEVLGGALIFLDEGGACRCDRKKIQKRGAEDESNGSGNRGFW
jgi:hypothetical protein